MTKGRTAVERGRRPRRRRQIGGDGALPDAPARRPDGGGGAVAGAGLTAGQVGGSTGMRKRRQAEGPSREAAVQGAPRCGSIGRRVGLVHLLLAQPLGGRPEEGARERHLAAAGERNHAGHFDGFGFERELLEGEVAARRRLHRAQYMIGSDAITSGATLAVASREGR